MPPVEDGTDRFNKILDDIGYGLDDVACFMHWGLPNMLFNILLLSVFLLQAWCT